MTSSRLGSVVPNSSISPTETILKPSKIFAWYTPLDDIIVYIWYLPDVEALPSPCMFVHLAFFQHPVSVAVLASSKYFSTFGAFCVLFLPMASIYNGVLALLILMARELGREYVL